MRNKKYYILGVVPARSGSKRLPGKNIRLLNGRPLIDYIIKTGLRSRKINNLVVTTDSKRIRRVAMKSGALVPFLRPKELATDDSSTEEALRHAVTFMEDFLKQKIDIIVTLQATSPFTTVDMIDSCIELLLKKDWDAVITIKKVSSRAEWIGFIDKKGEFKQIIDERKKIGLAKIKEYAPSGNVYVFKRDALFKRKKIIGKNTGAVIIPDKFTVDIDYLIDLKFAEFLLKGE